MIRKITLALAAVAALGLTALAPSTADAKWKGKHGHHHHHKHWKKHWGFGPAYIAYGYGCWTKRWVDTPWGPRLKKVYVCY